MSRRRPSPFWAHAVAVAVPSLVALVLAGACTEAPRGLGDDCLKNQDCQSNLCVNDTCASAGPLLDAEVDAEAGPPATDGGGDAGEAGDATMTADSSHPDAAREGSTEASSTDAPAADALPADAASDAQATDATADAAGDAKAAPEGGDASSGSD